MIEGRVSRGDQMAAAFKAFEDAAILGNRAPENGSPGVTHNAVRWLCQGGRIRSYVYRGNYRMVELLTGPNAGKTTAPHPNGFKPIRITDVAIAISGKPVAQAQHPKNGESAHVSLSPILERLAPAYVD